MKLYENIINTFATVLSENINSFLLAGSFTKEFRFTEITRKCDLREARVISCSFEETTVKFIRNSIDYDPEIPQYDVVNLGSDDVIVIILDNILEQDIDYAYISVVDIIKGILKTVGNKRYPDGTTAAKFRTNISYILALKIFQRLGVIPNEAFSANKELKAFYLDHSFEELFYNGLLLNAPTTR